jgi:hypothetical protein
VYINRSAGGVAAGAVRYYYIGRGLQVTSWDYEVEAGDILKEKHQWDSVPHHSVKVLRVVRFKEYPKTYPLFEVRKKNGQKVALSGWWFEEPVEESLGD